MRMFEEGLKGKQGSIILVLDRKDMVAMIGLVDAVMNNKKLNKRTKAYKLAEFLDNELPIF